MTDDERTEAKKWLYTLAERRNKMQKELTEAIATIINSFNNDTGVSVSGISIDFVSAQQIGKSRPEYFLSCVSARLDLEEES